MADFDRIAVRKEAQALGFRQQSPISAIREKCRECMGNSSRAIEECTSVSCALWPFRFGVNVWTDERQLSDEQRDAMAERLALARSAKGSA